MLFEQTNAREVGMLRALCFTLSFFKIWPRLGPQDLTQELALPRGLFHLFPDSWIEFLLSPFWLSLLPYLSVFLLGAAALGLRPYRLWGPLAFILIFLVDGSLTGFVGFISHGHLILYFSTLILAFSPAADGFNIHFRKNVDPVKKDLYARIIFLITFVTLLTYVFIGVHRFYHGGVTVFTGDALLNWLIVRSLEPSSLGFLYGLEVASSEFLLLLAKVGFVVITALEAMAFLCFINRRFALFWLLSLSLFHIFTVLMFNIAFWNNLLLLWVLILPRSNWKQILTQSYSDLKSRRFVKALAPF